MTTPHPASPILLVPGHWLGAWAWDAVAQQLRHRGLDPVPVTLPGLDPHDPDRATRTLDDQADALLATLRDAGVDAAHPAVVVGHSGANGPLTLLLDRHPELVRLAIWVDSGPLSPGAVFAPDTPADLVDLPLPDFDVLARQASLEGLDDAALARFRAQAVPEPGPVLREPLTLHNEARRDVPTLLVCCSLTSDQVLALAQSGQPMFAEVAALHRVSLVDLPTGHWPQWSRPDDLAELIASAASTKSDRLAGGALT